YVWGTQHYYNGSTIDNDTANTPTRIGINNDIKVSDVFVASRGIVYLYVRPIGAPLYYRLIYSLSGASDVNFPATTSYNVMIPVSKPDYTYTYPTTDDVRMIME